MAESNISLVRDLLDITRQILDILLIFWRHLTKHQPKGYYTRIMAELIATVGGVVEDDEEYARGLLEDAVGRDRLVFFDNSELYKLLGEDVRDALVIRPFKIIAKAEMDKAQWLVAAGVEHPSEMELFKIISEMEDDVGLVDFDEEEVASYTMFYYYVVPLNEVGLRDMPRLLVRLAGAVSQLGAGITLKVYDFNKLEIQLPNDVDLVHYDKDDYRVYVVYNVGKSDTLISRFVKK